MNNVTRDPRMPDPAFCVLLQVLEVYVCTRCHRAEFAKKPLRCFRCQRVMVKATS